MSNQKCQYLYVDVYGHPYCTGSKKNQCEFCRWSEEYKIMRDQHEMFKKIKLIAKDSLFKIPSLNRCTVYDHLADDLGHLPENMRDTLSDNCIAITMRL
ncbi:MAG: hypothetical protein JW827_07815 [Spirochaetes bacterium]|nr:hypothetical protein [Spirochaetota bacterium]